MLLTQGGQGGIMMIIFYVVIFGGMFYFFFARPQKKQEKAMKELHDSMQAGDSVLTTSGFYGVIVDVMDDTVIVEFGNNRNCRIPMTRESIQKAEKPNFNKTEEE